MFYHLVLGCLRDGKPRHGYDVCIELRARSGIQVNAGNVYRELAKLSGQGFIDATENPSDADPRRNPYRITAAGQDAFDLWLRAPSTQDEELAAWLAFLDRVHVAELPGLLERLEERLWLRSKALAQHRQDALAHAQLNGHRVRHDVAAVRSLFELKQVTAVLEFVEELRRTLTAPEAPVEVTLKRPKR